MREARVERHTKETSIVLALGLDGTGEMQGETGIGFLDHMLTLLARHGLLDLTIKAKGDLQVDMHHLVEDTGIVLGQALKQALGDKRGIVRYGSAIVPMDEALVLAAVDLGGRPYLSLRLELRRKQIGDFDTELVEEFLRALTVAAGMNLHLVQLDGRNTHHIVEGAFKALARALGQAVSRDPRVKGVPSSKGTL